MSVFDYFQLFVDLVFLFLILVFLLGRGWKRGGGVENQEAYREMVATLASLIREMKEESGEMQENLSRRQVEVQQAISVADDCIRRLKGLVVDGDSLADGRTGFAAPVGELRPAAAPSPSVGAGIEARIAAAGPPLSGPASDPSLLADQASAVRLDDRNSQEGQVRAVDAPVPTPRTANDDDARREKYRQVLDFAQKGWNSLDIARFTELPRGEVELLMRTKGKMV